VGLGQLLQQLRGQVGLPIRVGRQERIEVLARQELTRELARGNPVVPALIVHNAA